MPKKIGEILVANQVLTAADVDKALESQKIFGGRIGTNLLDLGFVDEGALSRALAEQAKVPVATPQMLEAATPRARSLVSAKVAARNHVVPLGIDDRRLKVAMMDPADLILVDELAFVTGCAIAPHVAPEAVLVNFLQAYYGIAKPIRYVHVGTEPELETVHELPRGHESAVAESLAQAPPPPETRDRASAALASRASAERASGDRAAAPAGETFSSALGDLLGIKAGEAVTPAAILRAAEAAPAALKGQLDAALQQLRRRREEGSQAAAGEHTLRPVGLEEAARMLAEAETRGDIGDALLCFAAGHFRRVVTWIVQKDRALRWAVFAPTLPGGAEPRSDAPTAVPLAEPTVLASVVQSRQYYMGGFPTGPADALVAAAIGDPRPTQVVVIPVSLNDKVVIALQVDNADQPLGSFDMRGLRSACQKAGLAMEVMLLRSQIRQVS